MACCGQKRDDLAAHSGSGAAAFDAHAQFRAHTVAPVRAAAPAAAPPDGRSTVTLQSRSRSALVVRGPVSGKRYQFPAGGSMQAIDRRDAEALVATGMFNRIWG